MQFGTLVGKNKEALITIKVKGECSKCGACFEDEEGDMTVGGHETNITVQCPRCGVQLDVPDCAISTS